jgi:hypothetical protein
VTGLQRDFEQIVKYKRYIKGMTQRERANQQRTGSMRSRDLDASLFINGSHIVNIVGT